jgi:hypothetical protein
MSNQARNWGLLILVWILLGTAAVTLLPLSAPKANDLGYVSACPFAPWSTLALLMVAGLIWAVREYLVTRRD